MCGIVELFCKRGVVAMLLVICLRWPCLGQSVPGSAVLQGADPIGAPQVESVAPAQNLPVVTYRDGLLAIDAENATLAEVLQMVAAKTGAVIDIPPGSGLERIIEHTGPGRAESVLARLLNGSAFDFVIVGTSQGSRDPIQVLLFPHKADTSGKPDTALVASTPRASAEPHLYGAGFRMSSEAPENAVSSVTPPTSDSPDFIPGAVLDQLQKERLRQKQQMREQEQQMQAGAPPQ